MPEPENYKEYEYNGFKIHLCQCDDENCTFFSCNRTGEPSKCEVAGCDGKIIFWKCEGATGVHRCYGCDFTYNN